MNLSIFASNNELMLKSIFHFRRVESGKDR